MTFPLTDDVVSSIKTAVKQQHDSDGFPQMSDYGIDEEELNDFLFDGQVVVEPTMESEKKRLTRLGTIFVIPVCVMAFFSFDAKIRLLIGAGVGTIACLIYVLAEKRYQKIQERKRETSGACRYCDDVMAWLEARD